MKKLQIDRRKMSNNVEEINSEPDCRRSFLA